MSARKSRPFNPTKYIDLSLDEKDKVDEAICMLTKMLHSGTIDFRQYAKYVKMVPCKFSKWNFPLVHECPRGYKPVKSVNCVVSSCRFNCRNYGSQEELEVEHKCSFCYKNYDGEYEEIRELYALEIFRSNLISIHKDLVTELRKKLVREFNLAIHLSVNIDETAEKYEFLERHICSIDELEVPKQPISYSSYTNFLSMKNPIQVNEDGIIGIYAFSMKCDSESDCPNNCHWCDRVAIAYIPSINGIHDHRCKVIAYCISLAHIEALKKDAYKKLIEHIKENPEYLCLENCYGLVNVLENPHIKKYIKDNSLAE